MKAFIPLEPIGSKTPHETPHKDQAGYVYLRVWRFGGVFAPRRIAGTFANLAMRMEAVDYRDAHPDQRVISSERVERAVETDDYLRRCQERGLTARYESRDPDPKTRWSVHGTAALPGMASTLRGAYFSYLEKEAHDAAL